MDKARLLEGLDFPIAATIYLQELQIIFWGRTLDFACEAQAPEIAPCTFNLRFVDCRDMRWQVYSHIEQTEVTAFPLTELLNFSMGRDQQRSPCQIFTDYFGLSLFYGELHILRSEG